VSIIDILVLLLKVYSFILLARVLMTWLPNLDYSNPIVRFLYQATEPVLKPIREVLPPMQGIDLSPLVVFVAITIITSILGGL
jgi:YggT family protein